jgi:hypothetical protein
MAANDMANTLKNPRPAVPFAPVGDDTIAALTQLAEIFKNKFQKVKASELSNAPIKAAENRRPAVLAQPILTSPIQHKHQTRSQKTIITKGATNTPLLPRVITPMTGWAAPSRVPTLSQNISARNGNSKHSRCPGNKPLVPTIFRQCSGPSSISKQMEYMALMKDPDLQPLWKRVLATKQAAFFNASVTSQEQTHVSLWKFQTSQKTEK